MSIKQKIIRKKTALIAIFFIAISIVGISVAFIVYTVAIHTGNSDDPSRTLRHGATLEEVNAAFGSPWNAHNLDSNRVRRLYYLNNIQYMNGDRVVGYTIEFTNNCVFKWSPVRKGK